MTMIPMSSIVVGVNDRKVFDEDALWQLARSIDKVGLAEPILVRLLADGTHRLVAGERRYRAHLLLGRTEIEATVREMTDADEKSLMTAENTGRVDLSVMEEARAYAKLRDTGMTIAEIADVAGVAEFRVTWRLSLLGLIPEVQAAIECGSVPAGPALELAKLDPNRQIIGMKAWLANPTMGAAAFKRLAGELAKAQEAEGEQTFGFDLNAEEWVDKAKAMKAPVNLRSLVRQLAEQLEALGYTGPLLDEARIAA